METKAATVPVLVVCAAWFCGCVGAGYYPPYEGGAWQYEHYDEDTGNRGPDYTGVTQSQTQSQTQTQTQSQSQSQLQVTHGSVLVISPPKTVSATSVAGSAPVPSGTAYMDALEWEAGIRAEGRGDCGEAARHFVPLELRGVPRPAGAARAMGRCHMRRGEYGPAATAFVEAFRSPLFRRDLEMRRMLVEAWLMQKDYVRCDKAARAGLRLFPRDPVLMGQLERCRKGVEAQLAPSATAAVDSVKVPVEVTATGVAVSGVTKEEKKEAKEEAKEAKEEAKEEKKESKEEAKEEKKAEKEAAKEEKKAEKASKGNRGKHKGWGRGIGNLKKGEAAKPEKPATPEETSPVPETKEAPANPPDENPGKAKGKDK